MWTSDISSSLAAFAFFLAAGLALRVVCVIFLGAGLAVAAFFGAALALGFCGMILFSQAVSRSEFEADIVIRVRQSNAIWFNEMQFWFERKSQLIFT